MSQHEPVVFAIDLVHEEARRRAEVVAALGPGWDPVATLRAEEEAHRRLYAGLDARQRATYAMLVAAGVLPDPGAGAPPEPGTGAPPAAGDGAPHADEAGDAAD